MKSKCCNADIEKTMVNGYRFEICTKCYDVFAATPPTTTGKPYHYKVDNDGNVKQLNEVKSAWDTPTTTVEGIKDYLIEISSASKFGSPEERFEVIEEATQAITHLIKQAELRGRIEQVMQDFMSVSDDLDIDESKLINWRDETIAQLKGGSDVSS